MACRAGFSPFPAMRRAGISRSWGASLPKSGLTVRLKSQRALACRSGLPPRSIVSTRAIGWTLSGRWPRQIRQWNIVGEIDEQQKAAFLGNALALLFPIDWPEPFGLVMIEAMACGTPVIAFERGAVSEIVSEGETGFVVRSVEEAVEAVSRAVRLSRAQVRAGFERRFTVERMADAYLDIYRSLTAATRNPALGVQKAYGPAASPAVPPLGSP